MHCSAAYLGRQCSAPGLPLEPVPVKSECSERHTPRTFALVQCPGPVPAVSEPLGNDLDLRIHKVDGWSFSDLTVGSSLKRTKSSKREQLQLLVLPATDQKASNGLLQIQTDPQILPQVNRQHFFWPG